MALALTSSSCPAGARRGCSAPGHSWSGRFPSQRAITGALAVRGSRGSLPRPPSPAKECQGADRLHELGGSGRRLPSAAFVLGFAQPQQCVFLKQALSQKLWSLVSCLPRRATPAKSSVRERRTEWKVRAQDCFRKRRGALRNLKTLPSAALYALPHCAIHAAAYACVRRASALRCSGGEREPRRSPPLPWNVASGARITCLCCPPSAYVNTYPPGTEMDSQSDLPAPSPQSVETDTGSISSPPSQRLPAQRVGNTWRTFACVYNH